MSVFVFFYCVFISAILYVYSGAFRFSYRAPNATLSYYQLKRSLARARLRTLPRNVEDAPSIIDVFSCPEIMDKYGKSVSGNTFYKTAYSCEQFSYCLFASDEIINQSKTEYRSNGAIFSWKLRSKSARLEYSNRF